MTFGPGGVGPYGDRSRWGWALRRSVPVGLGPTAMDPGGVGPYGDRSRWGWALRRSVPVGLGLAGLGPVGCGFGGVWVPGGGWGLGLGGGGGGGGGGARVVRHRAFGPRIG